MDRFAMFVDAGYLLAAGGALCCGTTRRESLNCEYGTLVAHLIGWASEQCGLPLLRVYWYDAARNAQPTTDQLLVADVPNVKLRLGRLAGSEQKGVDSLIVRDFMTLARERAMTTAFLVGGDEDLREGVAYAQDFGVRVSVIGVQGAEANQAPSLLREADEHIVLPKGFWEPWFQRRDPLWLAEAVQTSPCDSAYAVGLDIARAWVGTVSTAEAASVWSNRPVVPRNVDVLLLRVGSDRLKCVELEEPTRHELRRGFWDGLQNVQAL
jgi:uncharacterized LabA/DUF88 family protein